VCAVSKNALQQNAGPSDSVDMVVVEIVTLCVYLSGVIITPLTGLCFLLSCGELTLSLTTALDKTLLNN